MLFKKKNMGREKLGNGGKTYNAKAAKI